MRKKGEGKQEREVECMCQDNRGVKSQQDEGGTKWRTVVLGVGMNRKTVVWEGGKGLLSFGMLSGSNQRHKHAL